MFQTFEEFNFGGLFLINRSALLFLDPLLITYFCTLQTQLISYKSIDLFKARYNDKEYMHLSKKRNVSSNQ